MTELTPPDGKAARSTPRPYGWRTWPAFCPRRGPRPVTVEMLQADIDDGAPTNPDGTMNLVHYARGW